MNFSNTLLGPLAPPALPGFIATMALSETQAGRDPDGRVGAAPTNSGLPHLHRLPSPHAVLTTPVDRSGASVWFMMRSRIGLLTRTALAFPEQRAGRHPQLSFRGLLKLHSRYGLRICSPTLCGLCHEAPIPPVNPAKRPVSYPVIPTTPGVGFTPTGNLHPLGRTPVPQNSRALPNPLISHFQKSRFASSPSLPKLPKLLSRRSSAAFASPTRASDPVHSISFSKIPMKTPKAHQNRFPECDATTGR